MPLARALITLEPLLLALLLPAILTITPRTVPLLLILPLLWLIRRPARGHFVPPTPLNVALLLLLLTVLLNLWATVELTLSLPHIAGLLYSIALYVAVVSFANRSPRHFHVALAAYVAIGLALAPLALVATNWQAKLPLISALVPHLPNLADAINPNYLAGVLLWLAPVPLTLLAAFPTYARPLRQKIGRARTLALLLALLASTLILLILLLLTQSRSGLLGLAAALALISLVLLRHSRLWKRPRLLALLLLLALIIALFTLTALPPTVWVQLAGISDAASIAEPATLGLDSRIEIWQRALYGIQDFPLTGMGMGAFDPVVRLLYPLYIAGPDSPINHAHNHLLQTAVDLGIPGLIAYLALWFAAAAALLRAWHNTPTPWCQALALAFAAALLAYFTYGLTEAIPLGGRPAFILWYLLALIATLPTRT